MAAAKRPLFYTGGGVINSGPAASELLRELVKLTGFPITSTLMGLGAFPGRRPAMARHARHARHLRGQLAMHDCDVMICVGARFDDRITGRLDAFSPGSKKIHIDIDPSSINKNVKVDLPSSAIARMCSSDMVAGGARAPPSSPKKALAVVEQIDQWRAKNPAFAYARTTIIKPQYAIQRLYAADQGPRRLHHHRGRPAPDVGGAVLQFEEPNRWMTSGGLGTMGYGLPAAIGVQIAHPDALVIDIAGEASILMNMQEMSTRCSTPAGQDLHPQQPVYGHGAAVAGTAARRPLFESYTEALPDFVKLAEAYRRARHPLRQASRRTRREDPEMIEVPEAGDVRLRGRSGGKLLPDDPVGPAHNEMILGRDGDRGDRPGQFAGNADVGGVRGGLTGNAPAAEPHPDLQYRHGPATGGQRDRAFAHLRQAKRGNCP
jgi:acetolactate synthase I/II/III large subunit